jgi:hypothetical protein
MKTVALIIKGDSCESSNKFSGSIKGGEFTD